MLQNFQQRIFDRQRAYQLLHCAGVREKWIHGYPYFQNKNGKFDKLEDSNLIGSLPAMQWIYQNR